MKFCKFFLIFYIFILPNNVFSKDIFKSEEYIVKFKSNNINTTKVIEIDKIKIKSFKFVLNKVLPLSEYNKVNRNIDLSLVNRFILSININDEKIINDNYISKIKVNFNKNLIIDYFINNKIKFVNFLPDDFLIVIYDDNNIESYLLSENNSYYKYLLKNNNNIFNFVIPNLDYNDRFLFNKNDYENNNFKNIYKLNQKYKTKNIIFTHIKNQKSTFAIETRLINKNNNILVTKFTNKKQNLDNIFDIIYHTTINKWKDYNKIDTSIINNIDCKIIIDNIYQLKYVNNLLNNNKYIKEISLKSIYYTENIYSFKFFGNLDVLRISFERIRLKLLNENDNCIIKLI